MNKFKQQSDLASATKNILTAKHRRVDGISGCNDGRIYLNLDDGSTAPLGEEEILKIVQAFQCVEAYLASNLKKN